jgi:hypothetical protein
VTVLITLLMFTFVTLVDEPATAIAMVAFIVIAVVIDRVWRGVGFLNRSPSEGASAQDAAAS